MMSDVMSDDPSSLSEEPLQESLIRKFHDEDEEASRNQESSIRFSKIVSLTIFAGLVLSISAVAVYYFRFADEENHNDDDDFIVADSQCYVQPSCNPGSPPFDAETGFTNITGWVNISSGSCCQICPANGTSVVCFDTSSSSSSSSRSSTYALEYSKAPTPFSLRNRWVYDDYFMWQFEEDRDEIIQQKSKQLDLWRRAAATTATDDEMINTCVNKTGNQDYDYLLLDVMWLPQFCAALEQGHDPTLSHLAGTLCTQATTQDSSPRMSIHGLWPNYVGGYPTCCFGAATGEEGGTALSPETVQSWAIWPELQQNWFDPTTSEQNEEGVQCSICYLLNHEYEKHGACFSGTNAELYFSAGLFIAKNISTASQAISGMSGTVVPTQSIASLFPKRVNVMCDPSSEYVAALSSSSSSRSSTRSASSRSYDGRDSNHIGGGMTESAVAADSTIGVFLEIQTCWTLTVDIDGGNAGGPYFARSMIDCPLASLTAFTGPCPENAAVIDF